MKALKAICKVAILALALSVPSYAGDMHTPGYTEPPPPPPPPSNITVEMSEPTATLATSSTSDDASAPSLADIFLALASIF